MEIRKREDTKSDVATNKTSAVRQQATTPQVRSRRYGSYIMFLLLLLIVVWNQNVMKPKSNKQINDQQALTKKSVKKATTSIEALPLNPSPAPTTEHTIEPATDPPLESPSPVLGTFQSVSPESVKDLPVLTVLKREDICTPSKRNAHYVVKSPCVSESMGNGLSDLFIMVVEILQLGSSFEIQCDKKDGIQEKYWTNTTWKQQELADATIPNICKLCWSWPHTCKQGLNYGIPMMQSLFSRLPQPPSQELDDAVIHIRCGDVLKYKHHSEYGYPRYETYKEWLPKDGIRSIGILTANFEDPTKARVKDVPFFATCKAIVEDLALYLQTTFSSATVTIRNSDSVEMTAARMVYAKHAWCNPSTFCLYPTLATAGQAYLIKSPKLYPFVENIPNATNIHVVDRPFLNMYHIGNGNMNATDIIAWLRGEEKKK